MSLVRHNLTKECGTIRRSVFGFESVENFIYGVFKCPRQKFEVID